VQSFELVIFTLKHGRPQTFSQGGQNFPGGGQKHTICLKNAYKHTIFIQKSQKTYNFGQPRGAGGGGASAPFCPPLRTLMLLNDITTIVNNLNMNVNVMIF